MLAAFVMRFPDDESVVDAVAPIARESPESAFTKRVVDVAPASVVLPETIRVDVAVREPRVSAL